MSVAIQARGLVKHFGALAAVDGIDLEVEAGSVFAFLGPNGAGKTTTLHLLLGLLRPDQGTIEVLGCDVTEDAVAVRRRTGALLEHDGVYDRLTVEANLDLWGRFHGLDKATRKANVRDLLQGFDLDARRRSRVRTLSRGMKRKLAIARALIADPELVILDEPTVGLDPRSVVEIRERLRSLAKERGTTVFLTTHDLAEAERVADRVAVVKHGRIVTTGPPEDLAQEHGASRAMILGERLTPGLAKGLMDLPGVLDVLTQGAGDTLRLRLERDAPLAPVIKQIIDLGGEVEATERHPETLEEIFLLLTNDPPSRSSTQAHRPKERRTPSRPLPLPPQRPRRQGGS